MSTCFEPRRSVGRPRSPTRRDHPGLAKPATWAVLAFLPTAALGATLSVEGGPVVLGRTRTAEVRFHLDAPAEGAPLRLTVNVGSFSDPVPLGPGSYRALPFRVRAERAGVVALAASAAGLAPAAVEIPVAPAAASAR